MKTRSILSPLIVILAALSFSACASASPKAQASNTSNTSSPGLLTAVVEPSDAYATPTAALSSASSSIKLEIYELADQNIENILAQKAATMPVTVILDSAYSGASVNAPAASFLKAHNVRVIMAPHSTIYHAKYAVIDNARLLIGTGNLTSRYYATTRDFWITDTTTADVKSARTAFAADTAGNTLPTPASANLLWSPAAEKRILSVINTAHTSLYIENEEMASSSIISALKRAASRRVSVNVTMTYSSSWSSAFSALTAAGVHVHVFHGETPVYIHAKAICADCTTLHPELFVGSQNFSTSSLVYNRELGLTSTNTTLIAPISVTLQADFNAASPW